MEQKQKQFVNWFEEQILKCNEQEKSLLADDRADEATFEKIKANVYDIFRTVFTVAVNNGKGDTAAIGQFFTSRMKTIPAGWTVSYEKAKEHDDILKMQVERLKLDAIQEIRTKFSELWEG